MKKSLSLFSSLLVVTASVISPLLQAGELSDALNECRQQQNALKRLVCYDEISLQSASQPVATTVPVDNVIEDSAASTAQPATVSRAAPVAKSTEADKNFGLEHKQTADNKADQLYFTVSAISYSPRKELIVEFDNGQIWRQSGTDYYKIAVGEKHYVKRGLFNSFRLGNDDDNRTVKVRRVD